MKKYILFILPLLLSLLVCNNVEAKKINFPNGDSYEGESKKGQPHGLGKMVYANGAIYEGTWSKGKQFGNGKKTYINGDVYEGIWNDNSGEGIISYKNGNKYEGQWSNFLPHGKGLMYADNVKWIGNWENGVFINGIETKVMLYGDCIINYSNNNIKDGRIKFTDGSVYCGEIHDYLPNGNGVLYLSKCNFKSSLNGVWKNGKLIQLESGKIQKNDIQNINVISSCSIMLNNNKLLIDISFSDKVIEKKQSLDCSVNSISRLINYIFLRIMQKENEIEGIYSFDSNKDFY